MRFRNGITRWKIHLRTPSADISVDRILSYSKMELCISLFDKNYVKLFSLIGDEINDIPCIQNWSQEMPGSKYLSYLALTRSHDWDRFPSSDKTPINERRKYDDRKLFIYLNHLTYFKIKRHYTEAVYPVCQTFPWQERGVDAAVITGVAEEISSVS